MTNKNTLKITTLKTRAMTGTIRATPRRYVLRRKKTAATQAHEEKAFRHSQRLNRSLMLNDRWTGVAAYLCRHRTMLAPRSEYPLTDRVGIAASERKISWAACKEGRSEKERMGLVGVVRSACSGRQFECTTRRRRTYGPALLRLSTSNNGS